VATEIAMAADTGGAVGAVGAASAVDTGGAVEAAAAADTAVVPEVVAGHLCPLSPLRPTR